MRYFAIGMAMLLLGGCARLNVQAPLSADRPVDGRKVEDATGNERYFAVMRAAYQACLPAPLSNKSGSMALVPKAGCKPEHTLAFRDAGMTLSEIYCDDFLRSANSSARRRQYGRGLFNDAGGGIQAVLGLAKVASGVIGGVGVGFSAIDSTFRNYDSSFMVDADLSRLRRLVQAAQDNMLLQLRRQDELDKTEGRGLSIYTAERQVVRYAGLCTFLGMKGLLDESLQTKTDLVEAANKTLLDGADDGAGPPKAAIAPVVPAGPVLPPPPGQLVPMMVPQSGKEIVSPAPVIPPAGPVASPVDPVSAPVAPPPAPS